MKRSALLVLLLLCCVSWGQQSPYSNVPYPAVTATATGFTSPPIRLNSNCCSAAGTTGSGFATGDITLSGTALTTVTFGVLVSKDNGVTYFPALIWSTLTPATTATTVTATAGGQYEFSLANVTHVEFVTSGTFTATSVQFLLMASVNAQSAKGGGNSGGATFPTPAGVVCSITTTAGQICTPTQIETAIGSGVYAPLVGGFVPPANLGTNSTGGSSLFLNANGVFAAPSGTGGNTTNIQGTPISSTAPTQKGQALTATGAPDAPVYVPGNPVASNVQTAALTQPFSAYTTQATTCNAITDTNAKTACLGQDTAMLATQTALENAGLITPSNPLASLFTMVWNMAPVTAAGNTISSIVGTHVFTVQTLGGAAPPIAFRGQMFPTELIFGPCANGPAFATTCQSGVANYNNSFGLVETTSNSDGSCFSTDCTILFVGRPNMNQWLTNGSQFTTSQNVFLKGTEWEISLQTGSQGAFVNMFNSPTSAFVTALCPNYSTVVVPAGSNPGFFPNPETDALEYVWLVYNHTSGTFACAINDGPLGASTAVSLTAAGTNMFIAQATFGIEHAAFSPAQVSQANRALYYNLAIGQHAPNYTDPPFGQWQRHQIQNSEVSDYASPMQFTNGGTQQNLPYRAFWSQAHVTLTTNAPKIAFDFAPGFPSLTGPNASVRIKVDGVLANYDIQYTIDKNQIYSVTLDGNTHTIDVGEGATQANGVAPFGATQMYTGLGGMFIDSYFVPRGNYTTTIAPYAPVTSLAVATAGSGQTDGIYTLTSTGCLYPATALVNVSSGLISTATLQNVGAYCNTPAFTMPSIGGTAGTLTASIGSISTTAWVVDSILSGIDTQNGATDAVTAMERSGQLLTSPTTDSFGDTNTALVGAGFLLLATDCPTQTACNAWYQANVASLPNVRNIVMARGTNDFSLGHSLTTPECLSGFTSILGFFLNSVQAFTPNARVWMPAILLTGTESATDGCTSSTNTRTNYRAAQQTACAAYTGAGGCTFVDTTNTAIWPNPATTGNLFTDGLHYTTQGHAGLCKGWLNATGSSFPTCFSPE